MSKTRFGFWPRPWHVAAAGLSVEPVADYADVVEAINKHERAFDGWMHPPLGRRFSSALGLSLPWMPAKAYGLPSTHEMSLDTDDEALADFSIALIGLLDGMRLVREGWNHFYKTPIEPAKLVDFVCSESEMSRAIDMATRRWRALDKECQKWMFGAIHWYCFTAAYEHNFERFGGLYTVLDTLYCIHERLTSSRVTHAKRAVVLAETHQIPVPDWAQVHTINNKDVSRLSALRNEFFHEGRYGGEPIGFDFPEENITLELEAFVTRLILGMLSIKCAYVQTAATTQQTHGLDLSCSGVQQVR
jgi:hypothetical protein